MCLIALITALFVFLNYGPEYAPLGYSKWVWYGGAYTLIVLGMGIHVLRKYDNAHVRKRTLTLMTIQLLPNFLLANFVLQDWRVGMLILPWPLSGPDHLFGKGILAIGALNINRLWYGIGFLAILIIAVFIYGRRVQCSWICTSGALAETFGEPWRNRAPEGKVYGRWEWLSIVTFSVVLGLTVWLFLCIPFLVGEFGVAISALRGGYSDGLVVQDEQSLWGRKKIVLSAANVPLYVKWALMSVNTSCLVYRFVKTSVSGVLSASRCVQRIICTSLPDRSIPGRGIINKVGVS